MFLEPRLFEQHQYLISILLAWLPLFTKKNVAICEFLANIVCEEPPLGGLLGQWLIVVGMPGAYCSNPNSSAARLRVITINLEGFFFF